jgi:hypothetical protein
MLTNESLAINILEESEHNDLNQLISNEFHRNAGNFEYTLF